MTQHPDLFFVVPDDFKLLGPLLGDDAPDVLFALCISLLLVGVIVDHTENDEHDAKQGGEEFTHQLRVVAPEVGIDYCGIVKAVIHDGNTAENADAAIVLVEDF